jgi:hypothetical protein
MASRDQKHEKEHQSLHEKMMDLVDDNARGYRMALTPLRRTIHGNV